MSPPPSPILSLTNPQPETQTSPRACLACPPLVTPPTQGVWTSPPCPHPPVPLPATHHIHLDLQSIQGPGHVHTHSVVIQLLKHSVTRLVLTSSVTHLVPSYLVMGPAFHLSEVRQVLNPKGNLQLCLQRTGKLSNLLQGQPPRS